MIPGLNDAHVHALVPQGVQLNVPTFVPGPGPTVQEVLDLIAGATQIFPEGTWLFATVGTAFSEDPQAHRLTLDQVAPDHPVKLELWTGTGCTSTAWDWRPWRSPRMPRTRSAASTSTSRTAA